MKKIRSFFEKHILLSYIGDIIVLLLGIYVFPAVFMPNLIGSIIGLILAIIVGNFLGLHWRPLSSLKNKR